MNPLNYLNVLYWLLIVITIVMLMVFIPELLMRLFDDGWKFKHKDKR